MKRIKIKNISEKQIGQTLTVAGWVRSMRDQKNFAFIELNDGTRLSSLQIIAEEPLRPSFEHLTTGASIAVTGELVQSLGKNQAFELRAQTITPFGSCSATDYPLQKKRHSFEFLRTIAHLRPRTNTQSAVARVRSSLAFATHQFFHAHDFLYIHTPLITASDAEGGVSSSLSPPLNSTSFPAIATEPSTFPKTFSSGRPTLPFQVNSMRKRWRAPSLMCTHLAPLSELSIPIRPAISPSFG